MSKVTLRSTFATGVRNVMCTIKMKENKFAGAFCIFPVITLLSIWYIHLTSGIPEGYTTFEMAVDQIQYALNPNETNTYLFIFTIISIIICLLCSYILVFTDYYKVAYAIIGLHSFFSVFNYSWDLVAFIALPLWFAITIYINGTHNQCE